MEGYEIWLRLLSLGLGVALGLLPAQRALPRRLAGAPAAWALAAALTAAACTAAALLGPALGRAAVLYAGLGAVLGQLRRPGGCATAAVSTWVAICLPFTGVLCVAGGGALALATGSPVLGALAVPVFAAPIALLQFGGEAGLAMLAAAGLTLWCWRPALQGLVPPPPRRPGGPGGMG